MELYFSNINSILDTCAPFERVKKYKLKIKTKPWITHTLQKSVFVKNLILKKFINCNNPPRKLHIHI